MKPTPFPWRQASTTDPHLMRSVLGPDGSSVAWCGRFPEEEAHANARLIVDAARRLEVAQRLADALNDLLNTCDIDEGTTDCVKCCADALAEWEATR